MQVEKKCKHCKRVQKNAIFICPTMHLVFFVKSGMTWIQHKRSHNDKIAEKELLASTKPLDH